jgi:hypothetical protein
MLLWAHRVARFSFQKNTLDGCYYIYYHYAIAGGASAASVSAACEGRDSHGPRFFVRPAYRAFDAECMAISLRAAGAAMA